MKGCVTWSHGKFRGALLVDPNPFKDCPLACLSHISLLKVFQSLSDSGMLVHTNEALKRLMNSQNNNVLIYSEKYKSNVD